MHKREVCAYDAYVVWVRVIDIYINAQSLIVHACILALLLSTFVCARACLICNYS